jgi:hypothetical protein
MIFCIFIVLLFLILLIIGAMGIVITNYLPVFVAIPCAIVPALLYMRLITRKKQGQKLKAQKTT